MGSGNRRLSWFRRSGIARIDTVWRGLILLAALGVAGIAPWQSAQADTYKVLYSFCAKHGCRDGRNPSGLITDGSGNLYGTTSQGATNGCGNAFGCGVVFKLTPPATGKTAWTETVLYAFTGGKDGGNPSPPILGAGGVLYGVARGGDRGPACNSEDQPVGCGVVFKLTPPAKGKTAWTETVPHTFTGGKDGYFPNNVILGPGGVLYGTTYEGGDFTRVCGVGGCGVVFKLTPPAQGKTAWTETVLHTFTGGKDGWLPDGVILGPGGVLYGTSYSGETTGGCTDSFPCGMVFKLTPPAKGETVWT
jgi:uncharacterized protein YceK